LSPGPGAAEPCPDEIKTSIGEPGWGAVVAVLGGTVSGALGVTAIGVLGGAALGGTALGVAALGSAPVATALGGIMLAPVCGAVVV
jgi:predicted phage tail protein